MAESDSRRQKLFHNLQPLWPRSFSQCSFNLKANRWIINSYQSCITGPTSSSEGRDTADEAETYLPTQTEPRINLQADHIRA